MLIRILSARSVAQSVPRNEAAAVLIGHGLRGQHCKWWTVVSPLAIADAVYARNHAGFHAFSAGPASLRDSKQQESTGREQGRRRGGQYARRIAITVWKQHGSRARENRAGERTQQVHGAHSGSTNPATLLPRSRNNVPCVRSAGTMPPRPAALPPSRAGFKFAQRRAQSGQQHVLCEWARPRVWDAAARSRTH